jgi:predicted nucleotidyltransferase
MDIPPQSGQTESAWMWESLNSAPTLRVCQPKCSVWRNKNYGEFCNIFKNKKSYNQFMTFTALTLPPELRKNYHPLESIRRRRIELSGEISKRRRRALTAARKAARLLRNEFGAKEVILFGSLARRGMFTMFSDIDLAARGIDSDRFLDAADALLNLNTGFKIDLAEVEACPPALLKNIQKDGKPL